MSAPESASWLVEFQPSGDTGWFVTYDPPEPAETLPVAGWGTYAHEGQMTYRTIEPMVPDGAAGVLVAARELGTVANLEWKEGGA